MSNLLKIALLGAGALISASLGYEQGRKDALREKELYEKFNDKPSKISKPMKNLVNESIETATTDDIVINKEFPDNQKKFTKDELMNILCNNQVFDTVVDILKKNNGEFRPGYYFKEKDWEKYYNNPIQKNPPIPNEKETPCTITGANVSIRKNDN